MSSSPLRRFRLTPDVKLTGAIDEEARILSVPREATTKGMYLADLVTRVGAEEARAVWAKLEQAPRNGHYIPFHDYPFADALRWLHAVAHQEHAHEPPLEALRLLGRDTVRVFLKLTVGRVVKGMVSGARPSLLRLPAMWKITDPASAASATPLDDGRVRFELHGFAGWIDCGVLGTIEQVVMNHDAEPAIDVELSGPTDAVLVVSAT